MVKSDKGKTIQKAEMKPKEQPEVERYGQTTQHGLNPENMLVQKVRQSQKQVDPLKKKIDIYIYQRLS